MIVSYQVGVNNKMVYFLLYPACFVDADGYHGYHFRFLLCFQTLPIISAFFSGSYSTLVLLLTKLDKCRHHISTNCRNKSILSRMHLTHFLKSLDLETHLSIL